MNPQYGQPPHNFQAPPQPMNYNGNQIPANVMKNDKFDFTKL